MQGWRPGRLGETLLWASAAGLSSACRSHSEATESQSRSRWHTGAATRLFFLPGMQKWGGGGRREETDSSHSER